MNKISESGNKDTVNYTACFDNGLRVGIPIDYNIDKLIYDLKHTTDYSPAMIKKAGKYEIIDIKTGVIIARGEYK